MSPPMWPVFALSVPHMSLGPEQRPKCSLKGMCFWFKHSVCQLMHVVLVYVDVLIVRAHMFYEQREGGKQQRPAEPPLS